MSTVSDKFWRWLAWKLPSRLVYWAAIRLVAHVTSGAWSDTEVTKLAAMDALGRWGSGER